MHTKKNVVTLVSVMLTCLFGLCFSSCSNEGSTSKKETVSGTYTCVHEEMASTGFGPPTSISNWGVDVTIVYNASTNIIIDVTVDEADGYSYGTTMSWMVYGARFNGQFGSNGWTISEVKAITVPVLEDGFPDESNPLSSTREDFVILEDSYTTEGLIVLAMQNALKNV